MPRVIHMAAKRTTLFASLAKLWDMLRQNYIFYAWNILLDAGIMASSPPNATNKTSSRRNRNSTSSSDKEEAVLVMHAIDQFIMSQHRSMKLLQGGSIISFMETNILASSSSSPPLSHDDNISMNKTHHNQTGNASLSTGRSLLQSQNIKPLDQSIRVYSSIITATKGYSKQEIGKNQITDSWLQGPLRWPPR